MVSFNQIPTNIRTPGVFIEFDSSRANQGAALQNYRALLIGQRRSVGTQLRLELVRITSAKQAEGFFGAGSMLWEMAVAWFASNPFTETWAIATAEPTGTAATGTITITGSSFEAGTINLYIGRACGVCTRFLSHCFEFADSANWNSSSHYCTTCMEVRNGWSSEVARDECE
jgi:phage tail sheath gpL-like